jgi:hypothetical protein
MTSTDDQPAPEGRRVSRRVLAVSATVIVVVVAVIFLLTRGNDDSSNTTAGGGPPSGSPGTAGASPSASPGAKSSSSPSPSASKGPSSGSGSSAPVLSAGKPVQAALSRPARPAPSLVVDVPRVEKVQAKAEIPGEVSGPALRFTVRVRNTSGKTVPIKTALANLYYGPDRTPATMMTHPGAKNFPEKVAPGQAVTGVVLFTVPPKSRQDIVLEVIIDAHMRRIEFSGNCAGQC